MIDDAFIQRVASGEASPFGELFAAWSVPVYYYAVKMTGDPELARDVVQEAFIAYWNRRASLDNVASAKAFLYATVRNQIYKHARDERIHGRVLAGLPAGVEETDNLIIAAEVNRQVRAAVDALPSQTRGVIERCMDGLKTAEIAREMNISENTVKTLKKNGYKTLREKLGYLHDLPPNSG